MIDLARVLRDAGLPVVEYVGWRDRRAPGAFAPRGVVWHHDASPLGPSPGLPRLIAVVGNATTPPPLAQLWVGYDGTWTVCAGGRCNHAGTGQGWGRIRANRGNEDAYGVETDHTVGEAWPARQLDSLRVGTRALLRAVGASPADSLCAHREYAPGRKIDPDGLNMGAERAAVAAATTPPRSAASPPGRTEDVVITCASPNRCGLLSGGMLFDITDDGGAREFAQSAINRSVLAEIRVSAATWDRLAAASRISPAPQG